MQNRILTHMFGFWIADAALGTASVRSAVNYSIWASFKRHDVRIPFPQREVRVLNAGGPVTPAMVAEAEKLTG